MWVEFKPKGGIQALGLLDEEAVFQSEPFRFWACFVKDVRARVNGKEVAPTIRESAVSPSLFSVEVGAELTPGRNTAELTATGPDGGEIRAVHRLFFVKEGRVRRGDSFRLRLGPHGSFAGPRYRAELDGFKSASEASDFDETRFSISVQDEWRIDREPILTRPYEADGEGEARIRLWVRPAYDEPERRLREFTFRIER
jgi:hypothetical protein